MLLFFTCHDAFRQLESHVCHFRTNDLLAKPSYIFGAEEVIIYSGLAYELASCTHMHARFLAWGRLAVLGNGSMFVRDCSYVIGKGKGVVYLKESQREKRNFQVDAAKYMILDRSAH